MKINYLIILDFSCSKLIKIKLSEEEREQSSKYEDIEDYIYTIEDKYGFRLKDCCWMACDSYSEQCF